MTIAFFIVLGILFTVLAVVTRIFKDIVMSLDFFGVFSQPVRRREYERFQIPFLQIWIVLALLSFGAGIWCIFRL